MPLWGRDPRKWGRNKDIDLTDLLVDFPIHVKVNIKPVAEIKREAGAQHASQGGGASSTKGLFGFMNRLFGGEEDYMQVYPPVNGKFRKKQDLFDGI